MHCYSFTNHYQMFHYIIYRSLHITLLKSKETVTFIVFNTEYNGVFFVYNRVFSSSANYSTQVFEMFLVCISYL